MADILCQLPLEIQHMIWECIGAAEERVVTVDHSARPFKRNINKRSRFVREKPPILLHICQESRYWALSRYSSFFRLPPSKPWSYTGPRSSLAFDKVCQYVGVPSYKGSKAEMENKVTDHINNRQGTQGIVLRKLSSSTHHSWGFVPVPVYFDSSVDTLCLSLYESLRFQPTLWYPKHSPDFSKLRKLAFVLQKFISPSYTPPGQLRWRVFGNFPRHGGDADRDVRLWRLPDLQQLSLVVLRNREVFRFESDDQNLLKPGEWSYSLAPPSYDFKDEMGPVCTGVLWKIKLARKEGKCLMQLAVNWAPNFRVWECHKMAMYKEDKSAFGVSWHGSSERIVYNQWSQPTPLEQELVEGEDGKTFLGVSVT